MIFCGSWPVLCFCTENSSSYHYIRQVPGSWLRRYLTATLHLALLTSPHLCCVHLLPCSPKLISSALAALRIFPGVQRCTHDIYGMRPSTGYAVCPPSGLSVQGGTGIRMPAVPPVVAPSDVPSDREQIETELIKSLLWSYFQIVRCVHRVRGFSDTHQ